MKKLLTGILTGVFVLSIGFAINNPVQAATDDEDLNFEVTVAEVFTFICPDTTTLTITGGVPDTATVSCTIESNIADMTFDFTGEGGTGDMTLTHTNTVNTLNAQLDTASLSELGGTYPNMTYTMSAVGATDTIDFEVTIDDYDATDPAGTYSTGTPLNILGTSI